MNASRKILTTLSTLALLTACGGASESKQAKGEVAMPSAIRACYVDAYSACIETVEGRVFDAKDCEDVGGTPQALCPQENVSQQCSDDRTTIYRYGWTSPC